MPEKDGGRDIAGHGISVLKGGVGGEANLAQKASLSEITVTMEFVNPQK
jgi:hypothetical protein